MIRARPVGSGGPQRRRLRYRKPTRRHVLECDGCFADREEQLAELIRYMNQRLALLQALCPPVGGDAASAKPPAAGVCPRGEPDR